MFHCEWRHPNKKAKLVSIYVIKNAKDSRLKLRFHGTQRACKIGSGSLQPCDKSECYLCGILNNGFSLSQANTKGMFGPGIYSSVVSSKADVYANNHHIHCNRHVIILCGVDPGNSIDMKAAGFPGPCDSVEGLTKADGGSLEYQETVVYDPARIKPIGLVPPEEYELPPSPLENDALMQDDSSMTSDTEPLAEAADVPRYDAERSDAPNSDTYTTRQEIPQNLPPPASGEIIVDLSLLDRHTPFSKKVERLFHESWVDQTKTACVERIILFDIKSFPSLADGQPPSTFKTASRDIELLSFLIDLPLCFHGAHRACYIGDPGYPLDLCRNVNCAICSVFQAQYVTIEAGIRFESGPKIPATPSSSQADTSAKNHHIYTPQHAMILCACPDIAQLDTQAMSSDAPPPYTPSPVSYNPIVVPIGLIMYTRAGWHP
ncbi:hypothetical protein ASPZODRAFT_15543 [Penicilliopsis zonata CBS 506.65]|uniref:PARP catalytic domain-containing protein n=1 Tax=Penicilliopsis zonata CBS 506.65 TaxID=1073090 RepID=A0A1L9SHZ9_9EURO|nr:hypothetical protein ASPZODRAFT_15543 [Penicilliopsis zonata CBS 506.65]OJJ46850.1 hypothetical protein ASPZODRAFT_15543 [Penicilliopsis zonata CBS 506.65]